MRTVPEILVGSAAIAIAVAFAIYFAIDATSRSVVVKCDSPHAHIAMAVAKKGC